MKNRTIRIAVNNLMVSGDSHQDWFIGSSTDASYATEGPWDEWVKLARAIIAEENRRLACGEQRPS